jgi:hypothetical protein
VHHRVDVSHGLGAQTYGVVRAALAPAVQEELGVEGIEVRRREIGRPAAADPGDDVGVDNRRVKAVCTGTDARLHGREPLVEEERTDGRFRPDDLLTEADLIAELGEGLLSFLLRTEASTGQWRRLPVPSGSSSSQRCQRSPRFLK